MRFHVVLKCAVNSTGIYLIISTINKYDCKVCYLESSLHIADAVTIDISQNTNDIDIPVYLNISAKAFKQEHFESKKKE